MVKSMASVLSKINKNHLISRLLCLFVSTFLLTLVYNMFLVPNKIVIGGISGLAILIEEVAHIKTSVFISFSNIVMIILSIIFLGKKKTFEQLIGCITFIFMVNVTAPIAEKIGFSFDSEMIMIIVASLGYGIFNGFIYRAGYSTGGSDFLSLILSEKLKLPMTNVSMVINIIIISISTFVFGIHKIMLSVFMIYVSNKITNMILFGVSTSKMVYVVSSDSKKIEDYIVNKMKSGATEIKIRGGVNSSKNHLLMCVLHNAQYNRFKSDILSIDPSAYILVNNCYEVSGGMKFSILPF